MSSARVARRPFAMKSPAAAWAISIRVAALRRSVREAPSGSCAVRAGDVPLIRFVLVTTAGYAAVAQSAIRAAPGFRYGAAHRLALSGAGRKRAGPRRLGGSGAGTRLGRVPAPGGGR